jgi:hypothetical protein
MKWNNFLECTPAIGFDILIVYIRKKMPHEPYEINYYTCKSPLYMNIIGEHNMDLRFAFWTKINLDQAFDEIQS